MSNSPQPLPIQSRRLAKLRYQVEVLVPHATRPGSWMVTDTGRFDSLIAGQQWADAVHTDAARVTITTFAARDNWVGHHVCRRTEGVWS